MTIEERLDWLKSEMTMEEVDRTTIALPPAQEALLDAAASSNTRVIVALFSNYPYAIRAAQEKASAILWSAPGAQDMGSAMAETIFGQNAPAGRLNMTWYEDDIQLPDIDDYDIIKFAALHSFHRRCSPVLF